ncbi:MAG: urease accessory protein UreD [Gloeomargarita sp. SKYBB_i_bin120]|nr:urease accessory protein UreD [Gloeomargarita sp. SKYG98]MCS7291807.1 urease accessory protein UreD [Gloeomargarita sp. SKYB120]MDW8177367.1 urease accessory protein UreD [Gloeomargarita sp. SKYBB_i_bin120]
MGYWQGELIATWSRQETATVLTSAYVTTPWQLQRPFYPEGPDWCHTVALQLGGGMVGGDQLWLRGHLQAGTRVCWTTATAGKVYRSLAPEVRQVSKSHWRVEAQAILELFPQETILFAGAQFHQHLLIELHPTALCCGWEIYRFGRTARGERFLGGTWRSYTEIWCQDQPLWIDRQFLRGTPEFLDSPNALAGQPVVGTFWLVGWEVTADRVGKLRELLATCAGEIALTRLLKGLMGRYRGRSTAECKHYFISLWQALRQEYAHRPACLPRVWQLKEEVPLGHG